MDVPLIGDTFASADSVGFVLRVEGANGQAADRSVVVEIVDAGAAPQILSFATSTGVVDRGGAVTLNWQVMGASGVVIEVLDMDRPAEAPARIEAGLPPNGSMVMALPDSIEHRARLVLYPASPTVDTSTFAYRQAVSSALDVEVRCGFAFFTSVGDGGCPAAEAHTLQAAFQPFENGSMIWRGDNGGVYVLYNSREVAIYGEAIYAGLPDAQVTETLPAGRFQPVSGFGRVWANLPGVRDRLGWATAAEQGYSMTLQDVLVSPDPSVNYSLFFTLPNSRVVGIVGTDRWIAVTP
jgi:hypothetical protein